MKELPPDERAVLAPVFFTGEYTVSETKQVMRMAGIPFVCNLELKAKAPRHVDHIVKILKIATGHFFEREERSLLVARHRLQVFLVFQCPQQTCERDFLSLSFG